MNVASAFPVIFASPVADNVVALTFPQLDRHLADSPGGTKCL